MKLTLANIFFFFFFLLLAIYGFSKFTATESGKIFYFLIPILLSFYFFKPPIKLILEIKVLLVLLLLYVLSTIYTLFYHTEVLNHIVSANFKLLVIFGILFIFYAYYSQEKKFFDILLVLVILEVTIANLIYYFIFYDFSNRFQGTFGGSNEFAFMMMLYIYVLYYILYKYKIGIYKYVIYLSLIGLHILIIITLSRTAILGILIFYLFASPYFLRRIKLWKQLLFGLILVFIAINLYVYFEQTIEYMTLRFTGKEGSSSFGSRYYEAIAGINMLKENLLSIIIGNGTSITSSSIFPNYYYGFYYLGHKTQIHNNYLALIIENGIFSFIVFSYYVYVVLIQILHIKDKFKYVILGFLMYLLSFMMTIFLTYFMPFWMALIIILAHTKYYMKDQYD